MAKRDVESNPVPVRPARSRVESLESRRLLSGEPFWDSPLGEALTPIITQILMPLQGSDSGTGDSLSLIHI